MAKGMNESRFSSNFLGALAPAGRKVLGSARPELTAASTKDKFVFNDKAWLLMGLQEGDYIAMIDQNLKLAVEDRLPQDERFFIAKVGADIANVVATAKVGANKSYSYSGVWGAVIMNTPELTEASVADLVRAGLGILRGKKGKNYVGLKKCAMEVVQYKEDENELFEVVTGCEPVKLYRLINAEIKDHDPKSEAAEKEATADEAAK